MLNKPNISLCPSSTHRKYMKDMDSDRTNMEEKLKYCNIELNEKEMQHEANIGKEIQRLHGNNVLYREGELAMNICNSVLKLR